MTLIVTDHASVRCQQRGVPTLIQHWLIDYGAAEFDGRGGVVRYFSSESIRRLERELGRVVVRRMHEYLRCYLVECARDGAIITAGKRHRNRHILRH